MNFTFKAIFIIVIFFLSGMSEILATNDPKEKTIVISGRILDGNQNETLPGVSITTTGSEKTMYSDLNGYFFIYVKIKDVNEFKLEFSQIGYRTKTLTAAELDSFNSNLEVNLLID
jgi:hypothetical protein